MKKNSIRPVLILDARAIDFLPYGVGRYAGEMARRLPALRPDWQWIILRHGPCAKPAKARGILTVCREMPHDDYPSEQQHWKALCEQYQPDLIHSLWFHTAEAADCIRVLSVQDIIALKGYRDFRTERFISRQPWYHRSLEAADALVVSSMNTARDVTSLMQFPPGAIRHIPLAASRAFKTPPAKAVESIRKQYKLPSRYFFASGHYPNSYKNFALVLAAHQRLTAQDPSTPPLVVTGKNVPAPHPHAKALGFVPDPDMAAILAGAVALIYPSKDEGFGLPVLEAMACGTPVLCSRAGSIPEVAGEAALYFNPAEPDELADAMRLVLEHPGLRNGLIQRGKMRSTKFSWEQTAREVIALYKDLLENPPPKRHPSFSVDWSKALLAEKLPPPSAHPRTPGRFFQQAAQHIQQGKLKDAQFLLEREVEAFPQNPDALRELGKCLKRSGQWPKAAENFKRMLMVAEQLQAPDHLRSATFHLGECLLYAGKIAEGNNQLRRCLKIQPDHVAAKRLLKQG